MKLVIFFFLINTEVKKINCSHNRLKITNELSLSLFLMFFHSFLCKQQSSYSETHKPN